MTSSRVPGPPGPLPVGTGRDGLVAEMYRALTPLPEGAAALVAVSGGPDSAALAHLLVESRPDLRVTLGHVRHGLRDDEADVAAVRSLADALGVPVRVVEVSVQRDGEGLEAAARAERYAALRRMARDVGAGWVLTGHTADDQAETLLLRLARGTGVSGLAGMSPARGGLVRPLLRVRRSDVRRFVALEGVHSVQDPMNADRAFRRVRARHDVLPVLEGLAPDPVGALARLADLAREDARWLEGEAADVAARLVRSYGPGRALPAGTLASLDIAIARRVVRQVVAAVAGSAQPPTAAHVAAVLGLEPGQAVDLPDVEVTCGGGWIAFVPHDLETPDPHAFTPPGALAWPAAGHALDATVRDRDADGQLHLPLGDAWMPPQHTIPETLLAPGSDPDLGQVVLGGTDLPRTFVVRSRRPGDRVTTAAGTKKLQDLFVDSGVPRAMRDLVPVVTATRMRGAGDGTSEVVVWVPGIAVDRDAAVAGLEDPRLHLAVAPRDAGK